MKNEIINNEIMQVLSNGLFKRIIAGEVIQIAEINAAITLLIKTNISFDLAFTSGDRRIAKEAILRIYITPATSIRITIQFETGSIVL